MPPEENSMRDDFDAAIASIENDEEGAITNETQADAADAANAITAEDLNSNDEQETPEAEAQATPEAEGDAPAAEATAADETDADTDAASAASDVVNRPPASWPPAAREEWEGLPDSIKQQVTKREHEIDKALNDGAEHRKTGAAFQGIADRFAQVIAAEGATDALTGVEKLVETVATLRMGSAQQKAQKIAGFIQEYGIDIPMLDDMLSGNATGNPAVDPNDPVSQMINERLKPVDTLLERMDQAQREQTYNANKKAIEEVTAFRAEHEFYDDVSADMADLVEMADKRGVTMPLSEAYEKACAMHPQVSQVMADRANKARLLGEQENLEGKRNASSSIAGDLNGQSNTGIEDMSMREALVHAMENQA